MTAGSTVEAIQCDTTLTWSMLELAVMSTDKKRSALAKRRPVSWGWHYYFRLFGLAVP